MLEQAKNHRKELLSQAKKEARSPTMISSEWVRSIIGLVNEHTTATEQQISVKVLQDIAYLFAYGGMIHHGLAFYAVDLSPTGTGKTEVVKKCRQLLLSPVMEFQEEKLHEDINRYQEEILSVKGKEKDFIEYPKLHKCIHISDTSAEALFESFEAQNAQMIEMGELGRKLKSSKYQSLIDYIVDGYGASELLAPNYKNQRLRKQMKIESPNLFFYGDTTIRYLGKGAFFEHIEGGLLNRCFLVYNPHIPEFDELPNSYTIDKNSVEKYNELAVRIIKYATQYSSEMINVEITPYLKKCERYIYDIRKNLIENNSPFANLYARSIQNFRILINVFHLIKCFDTDVFFSDVEKSTVQEAFEFLKWQMEVYPLLMDELSGISDEKRKDTQKSKILQYLGEQKLPLTFREVQRKFTIKKQDVEIAIAGVYKHDGRKILSKI